LVGKKRIDEIRNTLFGVKPSCEIIKIPATLNG
jgi:hypothetical protein